MRFSVAEKFVSINGEGLRAGQLAVFIRLVGCNLKCSYCDTLWANKEDAPCEEMSAEEIYQYIQSTKVTNVTLTGGEPLLNPQVKGLLKVLAKDPNLHIEIETNGSIDLKAFMDILPPPSFTMDYKLPDSGMESRMHRANLEVLTLKDTVKFVAGSLLDLEKAKNVIETSGLSGRTNIYISPVFGKIELEDIVNFMKEYHLNGVTLQVQLHKIIWNPNQKGV